MSRSLSLACLRNLGLEEDVEEDKLDPAVEGRPWIPPPAVIDPCPSPGPSPPPPVRLLPDTGKGEVEAGLLAELCLLSEWKVQTRSGIKTRYSKITQIIGIKYCKDYHGDIWQY